MSTADVSAVLRKLPLLEPSELQLVLTKIKAKQSLMVTGVVHQADDGYHPTADYLLEGIHCELRRRGLLGVDARISKSSFPVGYAKSSAQVRRNLEHHLPEISAVEKVSLGVLAARCLADWMDVRHIPISPKSMLSSVGSVAVALDCAFPGYIAAGLLAFVWRS